MMPTVWFVKIPCLKAQNNWILLLLLPNSLTEFSIETIPSWDNKAPKKLAKADYSYIYRTSIIFMVFKNLSCMEINVNVNELFYGTIPGKISV